MKARKRVDLCVHGDSRICDFGILRGYGNCFVERLKSFLVAMDLHEPSAEDRSISNGRSRITLGFRQCPRAYDLALCRVGVSKDEGCDSLLSTSSRRKPQLSTLHSQLSNFAPRC